MIEAIEPLNQTLTETPTLPAPLQALERLLGNYWWSWSQDGAGVFRDLDTEIWDECEHNPRLLLERVSEYRLAEMATDPAYLERVQNLAAQFDEYLNATAGLATRWANGAGTAITRERPVAYFCAEYGVHNSLPLYSG